MFLLWKLRDFVRPMGRVATLFAISLVLATGMVTSTKSAELNVRLGEDFTTLDPAFWQSGAD